MPKDDPSGAIDAVHKDAAGQYAQTKAGSTNDGVSSAKPQVITGSQDATIHKYPPGEKHPPKDWDINFDPAAPKAD